MSPMNIKYHMIMLILSIAGLATAPQAQGQTPDQTQSFTPLEFNNLPFSVDLTRVPTSLPNLQSYAFGSYQGTYLFTDGRTNGLHSFTDDGIANFPPKYQNPNIWAFDPVTNESWSRPIADAGLSESMNNALSATAVGFAQQDDTLYLNGGYLYAGSFPTGEFTTWDTLTAIDLGEAISWVKNESGAPDLSSHVRQTTNPAMQVTGGVLHFVDDKALLTFGNTFIGPYVPDLGVQTYTKTVRSFSIIDEGPGGSLTIANLEESPQVEANRRRDLNVLPLIASDPSDPRLVALAGVFTEGDGVWTVPVEINADGSTTMADPTAPDTFRQGLNNYQSAAISLYSPSNAENSMVLAGGISPQYFDGSDMVYDENYGFNSQSSLVVRDETGSYVQYFLGDIFPNIFDTEGAGPMLFGTGAQFLLNPSIELIDGSDEIINQDILSDGDVLGWIFGGIAAEQPNFGATVASNELFEVVYVANPVPEPATAGLLAIGGLLVWVASRRRQAAKDAQD